MVDPAGGSWTIENLTKELSSRAWAKFQEIEKAGGLLAVLQDGSLQKELQDLAAKQQTLLAQRRTVKVGSNTVCLPGREKTAFPFPRQCKACADGKERLEALKSKRDQAETQQELSHLLNEGSMEMMVNAIRQRSHLQ